MKYYSVISMGPDKKQAIKHATTWIAISDKAKIAVLEGVESLDHAVYKGHKWIVSQYDRPPIKTEYTYVALIQVDQATLDGILDFSIGPGALVDRPDRRVIEVEVAPPAPACKDGHKHAWVNLTEQNPNWIIRHKDEGLVYGKEVAIFQCGICGLVKYETEIYPVTNEGPRTVVQYDITQHKTPPYYND